MFEIFLDNSGSLNLLGKISAGIYVVLVLLGCINYYIMSQAPLITTKVASGTLTMPDAVLFLQKYNSNLVYVDYSSLGVIIITGAVVVIMIYRYIASLIGL